MKNRLRTYLIGTLIIGLLIIGLAIRNAVISSNTNENSGRVITASPEYFLASVSQDSSRKFVTSGKFGADEGIKTITSFENPNYPDLSTYENLSVNVSIREQRLKIKSGNQTIFEAVVSTGKDENENATPQGDFVIEPERDRYFYNEKINEGAMYSVSFKNHGEYLFHSLPVDDDGNVIPEEAALLGSPSSHGCVRMSLANAKWFYENISDGIPVHISK